MKLALPQYSGKDQLVYKTIILPYTLCLNFIIFGWQYISNIGFFLAVSAVTVLAFTAFYIICGSVAVLIKNRFQAEEQWGVRLGIIIAVNMLLSALFILILFSFYAAAAYFDFTPNNERFVWTFFALGLSQVFLAFLHEGISRYLIWKQNRSETEQLRASYQRSRLQGLRSQVNPHFLFNSLNSLSSLISQEGEEAEKFLDEMSKVYRYILRNETDTLVTLEEELKFFQAYQYLLDTRYGSGLQFRLDIPAVARQKMVTPLALQTIIENAFTLNIISKSKPLIITISANEDNLVVQHNLQPKTIRDDFNAEAALDNLINKYNLIAANGATVTEIAGERIVRLSLLAKQNEVAL